MERNTHQKMRRRTSNPCKRPTHEDLCNLLKKLQKMMDRLGYGPSRERPRAFPTRYNKSAIASGSSQRGTLSVQASYEYNEVPVFNTYEEYHKMALQSLENILIVLNIHGKVVFVSQNVSPLLGYCPEDIMGKSLLNFVLDEQKDEVSEKIIFNLPLTALVGSLIEFCCYIKKENVGQSGHGRHRYRAKYQGREIYEYVKFILYLQDSYDESFMFFRNCGHNSRNIQSSTSRLLWEQQYYLVGNISVLRTPDESAHPIKIQTNVIAVESNPIRQRRLLKRRQRSEMQRRTQAQAEFANVEEHPLKRRQRSEMQRHAQAQTEVVNVEECPESGTEVRPLSHSSISTDGSASTSISPCVRTSSSTPSTDTTTSTDITTTPAATPTSGQGYVIEPKNMLEPQDMEFEVGPEFLLIDSQEEEASLEQGEFTEEDVKKPLEETKVCTIKENVIDEDSARQDASSDDDDDSCIIIEDTEEKNDPKIQEAIKVQEQEDQKAPEAVPLCPTTPLRAVRPEAVVEPIPRRTYQFHRPLLGERFAQLSGPRVMTQVYDLSISRSFHDELPSYIDIEEEDREQEQCEYELAQRIELLRNLPYERPGQQQTGQGQGPRVYRPREQVVTVIDDVGPRAMNFFGNNSERSQNEMHRHWEDPVDHAPPVLHHSSRSCQEMAASHQTLTASCQASCQVSFPSCQASLPSYQASLPSYQASLPSCQVSLPSCQVSLPSRQISLPSCQASLPSYQASAVSHQASAVTRQPSTTSHQVSVSQVSAAACHPSAMPRNASSDHGRENRPRFLPPGQDHIGYFQAEEDTNPRP
ncbi:circadian clock protein PASD1 [Mus caroli]|uniref:Circadian clock protein PASD1 n=1 Tax=Mus caroli TaxID=10089 RepID=A0A6P5P8T6_MUSCR|nr:circadian clock protein PASD1 [Mus caroli]